MKSGKRPKNTHKFVIEKSMGVSLLIDMIYRD